MVAAIGPETIQAVATSGPQMQVGKTAWQHHAHEMGVPF